MFSVIKYKDNYKNLACIYLKFMIISLKGSSLNVSSLNHFWGMKSKILRCKVIWIHLNSYSYY